MTDYPPRERAAYPLFHRLATRWRDDDVYGHMNNVVYYEYFDTAVNRWLVQSGALEVPHGPVVGLVAETGCKYIASVGFPDELEVGLSTLRVGGSSVIYGLGLFRAGEEEASALCRFVHVYVDTATRKPVPLPDSFRLALRELAQRG
ncbi:MAG: thioesterase family protein [Pseudomonadota bacterium]